MSDFEDAAKRQLEQHKASLERLADRPDAQPCECGANDKQSARHGHSHLKWCPDRPDAQRLEERLKKAEGYFNRLANGQNMAAQKPWLELADAMREAADALTQLRAERDAGWSAETVKRQVADFNKLVDELHKVRARAETAEAERDEARRLLQNEHMVTQSLRGIKEWTEAELEAERRRHT